MDFIYKLKQSIYRSYSSLLFPPLIIFVALISMTGWAWYSTRQGIERDINTSVDNRIESNRTAIQQRFGDYESILVGASGFYSASQVVESQEWEKYVDSYDYTVYDGLRSVGFARYLQNDQVESFISDLNTREGTSLSMYPQTSNPNHAVAIHSRWLTNESTSPLGFDMLTEPKRRNAIERARNTGSASMTETVRLLSDPNTSKSQPSFLIYVPVYDSSKPRSTADERRDAMIGLTFASFKSNELFNNLSLSGDQKAIAFKAYNGAVSPQNLIYQSPNFEEISEHNDVLMRSKVVELFGQKWTFSYAFDKNGIISASQRDTPLLVIIAGISLAILLSFIVHMLLKARAYELSLQKEHDIALARDELLSLASHQLRTPATTVKQYLGMVLQGFSGEVSEQQRALLSKAYTGNERQLYVINEMLHLAKVDSGRIQLARRQVNMGKLIQEIIIDQENESSAAGHVVIFRTPKRAVILHIDEHMLRMAIENLLNNAIKYTPEAGTISIKLGSNGSVATISITDSGVGISPEDIPKLFQQFTRIINERTELVGGTGIGLYLANHLVLLHGGSISVKSKVNVGTTFTIHIPTEEQPSDNTTI